MASPAPPARGRPERFSGGKEFRLFLSRVDSRPVGVELPRPPSEPRPPVAGSPKTLALPQKGQKSVPRARSFHERFSRRVAVFKAPLCRPWQAGGSARGAGFEAQWGDPGPSLRRPRISLTGKGSGGQQR